MPTRVPRARAERPLRRRVLLTFLPRLLVTVTDAFRGFVTERYSRRSIDVSASQFSQCVTVDIHRVHVADTS